MLLSTVPHPSMSDCAIPAKALIQSYPFLADSSLDGRESHVSYKFLRKVVCTFLVFVDEVHKSKVCQCESW